MPEESEDIKFIWKESLELLNALEENRSSLLTIQEKIEAQDKNEMNPETANTLALLHQTFETVRGPLEKLSNEKREVINKLIKAMNK